MRKSKRWRIIPICLLWCIALLAFCEAQPENLFQYTIHEDGVHIQGYLGKDSDLIIPDTIQNYPVVAIDDAAFYACNLTSVILPDSVRYIGHSAFAENPLHTITLPAQLNFIGEGAFAYTHLTHFSLPETVTFLGAGAFYYCHELTSVQIPALPSLPNRCFFECLSLVDVSLGEGVLSIGDECFYGCFELEKISLPNSIREIGHQAFSGCNSLHTVILSKGLERIGDTCFWHCPSLKSIYIPPDVIVDDNWDKYMFDFHNNELILLIENNASVEEFAKSHNIQYILLANEY